MKFVILPLLILSQNVLVDCNRAFDFMFSKMKNVMSYVSTSFKSATEKLAGYILNRDLTKVTKNNDNDVDDNYSYYFDRPVNYNEMKHLLNDYVKGKSMDTYTKDHVDIGAGMLLTTSELALWHGREMETHIVQTVDGYYLTVHRIKPQKYFLQVNRTVLLHHGLLGSSTDWILLGPVNSLPYILADAGYDVWLTNARGNYYSRGHLFNGKNNAYWKFSWEEMGKYDLPAVIDYIRLTKRLDESINFIGHSMGATAFLVLLSTIPKYNDYIRMGILLAPLAYMRYIRGPMKMLSGIPEETIMLLGHGEFMPSRIVPSWLATKYCNGPQVFCCNPLLFVSGFSHDPRWKANFIAKLMYHIPAGGSTHTFLHYMQLAKTQKFHSFQNPEDEFPLNKVTVPIAVVSSNDDWIASTPDVLKLYFDLPNPIDYYIIRNKNVSHTDLVWGTEAPWLVFKRIAKYLEKGLSWNSIQMKLTLYE